MSDTRAFPKLAAERVNPRWTAEREERVRAELERSISGRRTARVLFSLAAAVTSVALGMLAFGRLFPSENTSPGDDRSDPMAVLLSLEDGSLVTRVSNAARVTPLEVGPREALMRLESGEARFSVTPNTERRFRVLAGDTTVTVLGTVFRVALLPSGVEVVVERGRVDVACRGTHHEISASERSLCAKDPSSSSQERAEKHAEAPSPASSEPEEGATRAAEPVEPVATRAKAPPSWRALARAGDYSGAYARMGTEGANAVRDEPADLLFAADVLRLSGHAEDALPRLERVVSAHTRDARAPLAAFTLGRTLDELGRPREAAEAFLRARRLAPSSALAEDALAREIESLARAGEAELARERAREYLIQYPSGHRQKTVRRYAGLESP